VDRNGPAGKGAYSNLAAGPIPRNSAMVVRMEEDQEEHDWEGGRGSGGGGWGSGYKRRARVESPPGRSKRRDRR
jgi:hypothetical protein